MKIEENKMLKEVRCAIYTRKSNEDGLEQKFNSLDAQRVACEKYIKSREGWVALAKKYDDGGFLGKNLERPAIKELFEDAKKGEVDCVVVYTLDRLSRETKDSIEVTSFFRRHRVNFVAVTQIFDNNTPMGKFVQTVLSGAAQLEREMIVERVKNKIATSKEQGLWMGCAVETQRMIRNEQTKCLSCTIDEGRSLKVGLQEQALNNHKLL